jgi:hypothetical protein
MTCRTLMRGSAGDDGSSAAGATRGGVAGQSAGVTADRRE